MRYRRIYEREVCSHKSIAIVLRDAVRERSCPAPEPDRPLTDFLHPLGLFGGPDRPRYEQLTLNERPLARWVTAQ